MMLVSKDDFYIQLLKDMFKCSTASEKNQRDAPIAILMFEESQNLRLCSTKFGRWMDDEERVSQILNRSVCCVLYEFSK